MNPTGRDCSRIHQHSAGMSAATAHGHFDHFSDVKRACHHWLIKHNEDYRRGHARLAAEKHHRTNPDPDQLPTDEQP